MARAGLTALLLATAACGARSVEPGSPVGVGWVERGTASWYGPGFHGRATASGEIYDMDAMTGAHRTLPLGTRIRVTNLENGREVRLLINDRGPYVDDRILDVSRAAARRLGFLERGTARIRYVVLSVPDCFELQVGSFRDPGNARALEDRLSGRGDAVRTEAGPRGLTRVIVGPWKTRREAREARARLGGQVRACDGVAA